MPISVTPLHPHIGAEILGVDLRVPVSPDLFAEIEAAFNRHAVLVFPDQPLSDEQQIAFSLLFGPLDQTCKIAPRHRVPGVCAGLARSAMRGAGKTGCQLAPAAS